jgi:uncharacterized RDD family membrane protein YckC
MTLRVAGPGTRAYAFIIDWHIKLLMALAWLLSMLLLSWISGSPFPLLAGWIPAAAIYLLYQPVLELLMRGRTPGKRIAGARIVTLEGATPGAGALLMRNLFRLIDQLPLFYLVGLVCCMFTAQRVRIGDLAAGTVLVVDETKVAQSLGVVGSLAQSSHLTPDAAALVKELLDRWAELEREQGEALARDLLVKLDGRLDRDTVLALDRTALRSHLEALLAGR